MIRKAHLDRRLGIRLPNEEGERCNFDHVFDNRYYHIVAIYMAVIRPPFLSFYFHR
jgi:hypothetical protein